MKGNVDTVRSLLNIYNNFNSVKECYMKQKRKGQQWQIGSSGATDSGDTRTPKACNCY